MLNFFLLEEFKFRIQSNTKELSGFRAGRKELLRKRMEGVENLPIDCLESIFSHLSDSDLESGSLVCKRFLANVLLSKRSLKVIHPKVSILSAHLKRFTILKRIDLRYFDGDIDEAITEIARSGIDLEALDTSCQKATRIETLKNLGSNSKNLKVLNIHSISRLQDNDLVLIANLFSNLEELKIGYMHNESLYEVGSSQFPTDFGVEFLASKLKRLKKINLIGKHIVSDRSLVAFSLSCVFLKEVSICSSSYGVTENGIGRLLRNRPNLEALSIGYVKMNPSPSTITIENSISHAKALTSLEFIKMDVSDMLLSAIAKAKLRLKRFVLSMCNNFTVSGLLMVLANYQLTELRIIGGIIEDQNMNLLLNGDVSKLTWIEISECEVTKSALFLLSAKCPALEEIRIISNTDRQQYAIDELGFLFPNLRVLDLCLSHHHITSKGIKAILKSCKFLRKLILRGNIIEGFIVADDSELPELNLEELALINSWMDSDWYAQIAMMCPRLLSLDLSYSHKLMTESVKQIVRNITTLNCLYIRNTGCINVGDLLDWMLSTGNMASLKRIHVGEYCYFSEKQRDELLQQGCLLLKW